MKKLATDILEAVFHPLLMPLYGALLPFLYSDLYFLNKTQGFLFFLLIAVASFILPMLMKLFFATTNKSWFHLSDKQLELIPYTISVPLTVSVIVVFYRMGVPLWYVGLLFASVVVVFLTAITAYFWNISKALFGMGGVLGAMMCVCYFLKGVNPFVLFIFIVIAVGLLASLQLATGRHDKKQVYFGFLGGWLVGFASILLPIYVLLQIG